jgi:glycosyltransferase involved in cell wall biosynthesis
MFSIVIPTLNNFNYLKICLESLKKNSDLTNEIIIHINSDEDESLKYVKESNYKYTFSKKALGMCSSVNLASKLSKQDYILYAHDDMYFLPGWDLILKKEILKQKDNNFFLSGTTMGITELIQCNFGSDYRNFNEVELIKNYKNLNLYDYQGTHYAPHVVHKDIWKKVSGFSKEFEPGFGSDPDLNMKLWKAGIRIFKGINNFKVYHFGSISMRKKKSLAANNGARTFLKKWGFSIKFFKLFYLKTGTVFNGPLPEPVKNLFYFFNLFVCKAKLFLAIFQK